MKPSATASALRHLASRIDRRASRRLAESHLRSVLSSVASGVYYEMPPGPGEDLDQWVSDHRRDAIAYAAGWTGSGLGYGPDQAKAEWPENPGFDWEDGLPDWDTGLVEEDGYEYRTSLVDGDAYGNAAVDKTADGFELVKAFSVNPEPEVYDEQGSAAGNIYIGEGVVEAVYRRPYQED